MVSFTKTTFLVALAALSWAPSCFGKGVKGVRKLGGNKDTGVTGNTGRYSSYFFDHTLAAGTLEIIFKVGPIAVQAECDPQNMNERPGGSRIMLHLYVDTPNELLLIGQARDPIRGGSIVNHVLDGGSCIRYNRIWAREHVGNNDLASQFSESGAVRAQDLGTDQVYFLSWNGQTIIGIHEDDEDISAALPGTDCIITGKLDFVNPGNGVLKPSDWANYSPPSKCSKQ